MELPDDGSANTAGLFETRSPCKDNYLELVKTMANVKVSSVLMARDFTRASQTYLLFDPIPFNESPPTNQTLSLAGGSCLRHGEGFCWPTILDIEINQPSPPLRRRLSQRENTITNKLLLNGIAFR
jgi:hypothetical protein